GMAGTGGQVADPILIKSDITTGSVKEGLRMAEALGAKVVSMSFSGECDNVFCEFYYTAERYADAFWDAKRAGMFLAAAAGNDNWDARNTIPCRYNGAVMCVGATNQGDTNRVSYSNYGDNVDIFAPTDIPVWGPSETDDTVGLNYHNGTSASTPYVAGVAALLIAAKPTLTPDDVFNTLVSTAHTDSADPLVTRYLSAIDAIRSLFDNHLDPDALEPNNSRDEATANDVSTPHTFDFGDLTLDTATDQDYFLFHVHGFFGVHIDLYNADPMTHLEPVLVRLGGGFAPTRTSDQYFVNVRAQTFTGLGPGDYLLTVRHAASSATATRRETFYHPVVQFTGETGPTGDAFESNNSFATAHDFGANRGSYSATIHSSLDNDFYKFTVGSPLGSEEMHFVIRATDAPLTLVLYDSVGTAVATTTSNDLALSTGTWTVRVYQPSSSITRYSFTTLGAVPVSPGEASHFSPHPSSYWRIIAELGNMDMSIIRGAEYLLLPSGPRPNEFTFYGNVDVAFMDRDGNTLREGTRQSNGQGGFTTLLSTKGLAAGDLVIRVSVSGFDASVVDEQEWADTAFPSEHFGMFWTPVQ
ncbi:MAG TPA: S8 family serine peptidase, partial [Bdellovibrionota bacterium]|nr:S8 family serine peptidase [Bdellovibrionota bacterium]